MTSSSGQVRLILYRLSDVEDGQILKIPIISRVTRNALLAVITEIIYPHCNVFLSLNDLLHLNQLRNRGPQSNCSNTPSLPQLNILTLVDEPLFLLQLVFPEGFGLKSK